MAKITLVGEMGKKVGRMRRGECDLNAMEQEVKEIK
jgi:hypothetical protein